MDLLICTACGVQYDSRSMKACRVCDDPRQFVPAEGQTWTTLRELQASKKFTNEFHRDAYHSGMISIVTTPQVAIGQRCFLLCTPLGNILWDCITYLDDATVQHIKDLGGISAIVISHPHYFSTSCEWGQAFDCPVYLSQADSEWVARKSKHIQMWDTDFDLLDGEFRAVKTGGHFPGSSVLLWKRERKLFIADTVSVVPSGVYHHNRVPGTASFTFMYSYPNMIPLPPDEVYKVWEAIAPLEFDDAHAAFMGRDARGQAKERMLESAKLFVKFSGHADHAIHHAVTPVPVPE